MRISLVLTNQPPSMKQALTGSQHQQQAAAKSQNWKTPTKKKDTVKIQQFWCEVIWRSEDTSNLNLKHVHYMTNLRNEAYSPTLSISSMPKLDFSNPLSLRESSSVSSPIPPAPLELSRELGPAAPSGLEIAAFAKQCWVPGWHEDKQKTHVFNFFAKNGVEWCWLMLMTHDDLVMLLTLFDWQQKVPPFQCQCRVTSTWSRFVKGTGDLNKPE